MSAYVIIIDRYPAWAKTEKKKKKVQFQSSDPLFPQIFLA